MALVHDDDLARFEEICDTQAVGRSSIQYTVALMFSCFQTLDGLQSDVMLSHIRSFMPPLHYTRIGELFQYRKFSTTHIGGVCLEYLWSARNSASADTESAWIATLSNIFERRCRFHGFLSLYVGHIASDSSGIEILCTSNHPRWNAVTPRRTTCKTGPLLCFLRFRFLQCR
jgi:hypothetical protein